MILLDTHALLWIDSGAPISAAARAAPDGASGILISTISGWEIALLTAKGHIRPDLAPEAWMGRVLAQPGTRSVPLSMHAALNAASPPGDADPMDRLLVATARELDCPLMTRDKILRYSAEGYVQTISC